VESQHLFATRKLVDTDAEQALLEQMIEQAKPPAEAGRGLHYLLFTPFRYPPLRHGSRFGTRRERGIWYGSARPATALAEKAYYLLLFLEGTAAPLTPWECDVSLFEVAYATARGVDLTRGELARHRALISSPESYEAAQALGREMRADGAEAVLYTSARDPEGGANVALFAPSALSSRRPGVPQSWRCLVRRDGVEVVKEDVFRSLRLSFPRAAFEVNGRLPAPAL
jgi:hypothetical protein